MALRIVPNVVPAALAASEGSKNALNLLSSLGFSAELLDAQTAQLDQAEDLNLQNVSIGSKRSSTKKDTEDLQILPIESKSQAEIPANFAQTTSPPRLVTDAYQCATDRNQCSGPDSETSQSNVSLESQLLGTVLQPSPVPVHSTNTALADSTAIPVMVPEEGKATFSQPIDQTTPASQISTPKEFISQEAVPAPEALPIESSESVHGETKVLSITPEVTEKGPQVLRAGQEVSQVQFLQTPTVKPKADVGISEQRSLPQIEQTRMPVAVQVDASQTELVAVKEQIVSAPAELGLPAATAAQSVKTAENQSNPSTVEDVLLQAPTIHKVDAELSGLNSRSEMYGLTPVISDVSTPDQGIEALPISEVVLPPNSIHVETTTSMAAEDAESTRFATKSLDTVGTSSALDSLKSTSSSGEGVAVNGVIPQSAHMTPDALDVEVDPTSLKRVEDAVTSLDLDPASSRKEGRRKILNTMMGSMPGDASPFSLQEAKGFTTEPLLKLVPHQVRLDAPDVSARILTLAKSGGGEVRIDVTPPDESSFKIALSVQDGQEVKLIVTGASDSTRTRLDQSADQLRQQFLQMGLNLSLDFGHSSFGNSQWRTPNASEISDATSTKSRSLPKGLNNESTLTDRTLQQTGVVNLYA